MKFLSENHTINLKKFEETLLRWNKKINLISKGSESSAWNRHIQDSYQLLKYINIDDIVFDLGSGGGFPGIVLSICGIKNIYLFESDVRKATFLNYCKNLTSNSITIINDRIENIDYTKMPLPDVITSRALADIEKLLQFYNIINAQKKMLLLKGKSYEKELEEAEKKWHFEYEIHPSETSIESVIIEIKNVRPHA